MKYFSLFSGIGGFELGIEQAYENLQKLCAQNKGQSTMSSSRSKKRLDQQLPEFGRKGLSCVGYSEVNKYAIDVYQSHFNHKNYGDITKINADSLPGFDVLVGGFPCQSFSIAGKRGGFEDTRGTLFFDIARIVRAKRPRLIFLENVKGLLSHDAGNTFATIIRTIDELGYDVQWQVLNSKNFGVPQNRERVFIVGHLRGTPRPEVFPILGQAETATGDVFVDESQWRREGKLREYQGVSPTLNTVGGGGHLPLILQKARGKNTGGVHEISPTVSASSFQDNNHLVRYTEDGFHQYRNDKKKSSIQGTHVTVDSGKVNTLSTAHVPMTISKTVRSGGRASPHGSKQNWDSYEIEGTIRRLTPKECERLQSFPDDWTAMLSDAQRYKCLGNAVTVNVIQAIIEKML